MAEISELLQREVAPIHPAPDGLERTLRKVRYRRRNRRLAAGLVAFAASGAGIAGVWQVFGGGAEPVRPADSLTGRIAFVRFDGNADASDIFVMDADGTEPRLLVEDASAPAWSPDGSGIAFTSDRSGTWSIYLVNADGTGLRLLVENGSAPAWSSDGTRIVFTREAHGNYSDFFGDYDLFVTDLDGNMTRLTDSRAREFGAAWSPDGHRLAVSISQPGRDNTELYLMNADGTDLVRVTRNSFGEDVEPAWSPDGTLIAFAAKRIGSNDFDIYVVRPDGSGLVRLTDNLGTDAHPTWSPDGTRIAFWSVRDGNQDLYMMDSDGTDEVRITRTREQEAVPTWAGS